MDLLKVDKTFVDRVAIPGSDVPLVRAILGLARELGMNVVAEGIETQGQLTRLHELGCELGQGYFLARPRPPAEIDAALRSESAAA